MRITLFANYGAIANRGAVGLGLALSLNSVTQAQTQTQNVSVFQSASVELSRDRFTILQDERPILKPANPTELQQEDAKRDSDSKADEKKSTDEKGGASSDSLKPITIAPLKIPNIAVASVGNGSTPKDTIQGRLPPSRMMPTGASREYGLYSIDKQFAPSAICHKPLYFQDTMLERHGHQRFPNVQPLASGVRFFGTIPIMPYLMTLHPPGEDIYNLGHYRPGSGAPCLMERPPYDQRAIRVQALTTAGVLVAAPL